MNQENKQLQLTPSRLPMVASLAKEYDITPGMWRVLVEQTFPNAKTPESVLMALEYCRSRDLDIMKRPVHIVEMWSSAKKKMVETVWPGLAEIRTTAARTKAYAGIDEIVFGPDKERTFTGVVWDYDKKANVEQSIAMTYPEWAKATVYRFVQGQKCAFTCAPVYWEEIYATQGKSDLPNNMWQKRTRGQLAKCAEVAAIRMAFPEEVGSDYIAEEMQGQVIDHVQPKADLVAPEPPAAAIAAPTPPKKAKPAPATTTEAPTTTPAPTTTAPTQSDAPAPPAPPAQGSMPLAGAATKSSDGEDHESILVQAHTFFQNCETAGDLEDAWSEFQHYLEVFNEKDAAKLQSFYDVTLQRVEPNPLRG